MSLIFLRSCPSNGYVPLFTLESKCHSGWHFSTSRTVTKFLKGTGSRHRINIFWQKRIILGVNKSFYCFFFNFWDKPLMSCQLAISHWKQLLCSNNRNRLRWTILDISQDGIWTDFFEKLSKNSLKRDLSIDTTDNPPLFSTFKVKTSGRNDIYWSSLPNYMAALLVSYRFIG